MEAWKKDVSISGSTETMFLQLLQELSSSMCLSQMTVSATRGEMMRKHMVVC